jgi:3-isopropylmalate/(R)-2-methylmalate dehydratase small subunit
MSEVEANPYGELTVDLEKREISVAGRTFGLSIPDGPRQAFLNGTWDSTAELLAGKDMIAKTAARLPYLNHFS